MKILSIGTDRKVFEQGSAVRMRLLEYGQLAEELHVIVFAKRSLGYKDEKIAHNIFIYPTNSFGRFFHIPAVISRARALKKAGIIIDVVTTQDPFEAGVAGFYTAQILSAKLHLQVHTDVMSPYFLGENVLNWARQQIAKLLLARANGIRVVSERIKKSIEKFVRSKTAIVVLPIFVGEPPSEGIPPSMDLRKKYPQFNFRALVISRFAPEKNIESVINAVASVVKMESNAGLIIVGDGPEKNRLQKLVNSLGIEKSVFFEGWQEKLFPYYKTADVFVLSSLYEGYGMVVVEAALAGCPVIMTDVGCAGEVIKDGQNGLIVPVGDTSALARAIERVVSGELEFSLKPPVLPTKREYLAIYRKSWETTLL